MEILLHTAAHYVALCIEAIAIGLIAAGAIEALIAILRVAVRPGTTGQDRRAVWLMKADANIGREEWIGEPRRMRWRW